jgi:hypothetical protein
MPPKRPSLRRCSRRSRRSRCSKRCSRQYRDGNPAIKQPPLTAQEAKRLLKEKEERQRAYEELQERLRLEKEEEQRQKKLKFDELCAYEEAHPEIPYVFILFEQSGGGWKEDGKMWFRGVYTSRKAASEASKKACLHSGQPVVIRRLPDREPPFFQSQAEKDYYERDHWSD